MTRYRVEVSPPADKHLTAVRDRVLKTRLMLAIHALGDKLRPAGCVKLVGRTNDASGWGIGGLGTEWITVCWWCWW